MSAGLSGSVGNALLPGWALALLALWLVAIAGGEIWARWTARARDRADRERPGASEINDGWGEGQ